MKEKTADELFEELGYELWTDDKENIFYKGENKNIIFDKYTKEICLIDKAELDIDITMQELQAINKKVEELRMDEINIHIQTNEPEKLLLEILKIILQSNKQEWWEM